jgi:glycosyltransferase involved in cell wall biosynthesis
MVTKVVVAWHNPKQKNEFLEAWKIPAGDSRLVLQQDETKAGCAKTKNAGIARALAEGADVVCVLDDDCYPFEPRADEPLDEFIEDHLKALEDQEVQMVVPTMVPHPRGFPYRHRTIKMRVAASIGLWVGYPDLDAMTALVIGDQPEGCRLLHSAVYGTMFPFCGMNYAFRKDQTDCAVHIDVPRFDDIWMGWIWERVAYDKGQCFNMDGPLVRHTRQSNVWKNLEEETKYMFTNETLWSAIYAAKGSDPKTLRELFT